MKCAIVPVTLYQQNCSFLLCEKTHRLAIVDPGGDIAKIQQTVEKLQGRPEKIFLTHGHMDHCAAAGELRDLLDIPIEGPHIEDKFWIDKLPEVCAMSGFPHADPFVPDRWLTQGDTVAFGEETLEVRHCPGHTPGHIIFFHRGEQLALAGDGIFQGSSGRTDFPRGDYDTLVLSIREQLWPLGDEVTFIPGHGPTSTFGRERKTNPFVSDSRFG